MTDTTEQKALALVEECSEYGALYKNYREVPNSLFHKALCRAADRIEALEAEVERLRELLDAWLGLAREHLDTELAGRTFEALERTRK